MEYEPKILVNKTGRKVEFFCDSRLYVFMPGEQRALDGFVAHHALHETKTGLSEVGVDTFVKPDIPIKDFTWNQLRHMKDKKGNKFYKMGMDRKTLIELIEKDAQ